MTAKIKLNAASGGGSISIQAPSSSSNNRVISLPDIADGTLITSQSTLDSTKLSPAITAGITMAHSWHLTSSVTVTAGETDFTSNWSSNQTPLYSSIGSGMSESSGIFTFPSTGIYLITCCFSGNGQTSVNYAGVMIEGTSNNFTGSNRIGAAYGFCENSGDYVSVAVQTMYDVTDTANNKVKFRTEVHNTFNWNGSAYPRSGVTFIKLGET